MCVAITLIGSDMDPHCWIHNGFRRHVRQDLEGARYLQKCEDEEEGMENKSRLMMNTQETHRSNSE